MSIRLSGQVQLVTASTQVANHQGQFTLAGRFQLDGSAPKNGGRIWRCQYDQGFGLVFESQNVPKHTRLFVAGQNGTQVQAMIPISWGVPVHFCATWDEAGSQKIWINGQAVQTRDLTVKTASQSGTIELGAAAQSDTTIITLAGLVILDTCVTDEDALMNREDPIYLETTYADRVRWLPDLTGPEGVAVKLGDPGLVDEGSIKKDLIKISGTGTATWSEAALLFRSPLEVRPRITKKGKNIAFFLFNVGDGSRAYPTTVHAHPTLCVDGRTYLALAGPAIFHNPDTKDSLPFVLYRLPLNVLAGQDVTYSAPDSWAATTAGGAPGAIDEPVANGVGQPNFDLPEEITMDVGLNCHTQGEWLTNETDRDLVKQSAGWNNVTEVNALGKPTKLKAGQRGWLALINKSCSNGLDPLRDVGITTIPGASINPCQYIVVCEEGSPASDTDPLIRTNNIGGSGPLPNSPLAIVKDRTDLWWDDGKGRKVRVFEVSRPASPASFALGLTLSIKSADFQRLSVYGPGNDAKEEDLISENWKRQMRGAKVVRYMDYLRTNNSNYAYPEDLPALDLFNYRRVVSFPALIRQMEPVDRIEDFVGIGAPWQAVKVTTAMPHGFASGQYVKFSNCVNQSRGGIDRVEAANGTSAGLKDTGGAIWVLNANQFETVIYNGGCTGPNPSNTAPGVQNFDASCSEVGFKLVNNPFERPFQHSASIGADAWICFPFPGTDELVHKIACLARDYLPRGLKLWAEFSNELWNYGGHFQGQCWGSIIAANKLGITGPYPQMQYAALRASQIHRIVEDVFAEAGRSEDLVRVLSWRDQFTGTQLEKFLDWCLEQKIRCDALEIAPYRQIAPGWVEALDPYDLDQMHDFLQLLITHVHPKNSSDPGAFLPSQKAILKSRYPDAKFVCYEGAQEKLVNPKMTNYIQRTRDLWYDPEMYHTYTAWLAMLQNAGVDTYIHYSATMDGAWEGGSPAYCTTWGLYKWPGQFAGKGDGSDGRHDNRTCRACDKPPTIHQDERCVSVAGQAFIDWSKLCAPGS